MASIHLSTSLSPIQAEVAAYFDKQHRTNQVFQEAYLPLFHLIYGSEPSFELQKAFFQSKRLYFDTQQGFHISENSSPVEPEKVLLTLYALKELAQRIFRHLGYWNTRASIHVSIVSPVIRQIKSTQLPDTDHFFECIAAYKNWYRAIRENTSQQAQWIRCAPVPAGRVRDLSWTCHDIKSTIPQPEEHPLNPSQVKEWIAEHPSKIQKLAKQFAKHITYISFARFQEKLRESIESFKIAIGDKAYLAVLPDDSLGTSNRWTTALALHMLPDYQPVRVISEQEISTLPADLQDIKHLVFFDDASYSGKPLQSLVKNVKRQIPQPEAYSFYAVIPFMTTHSITPLNGVWISSHQTLFSIGALFAREEKRGIFAGIQNTSDTPDNWTLTYFAHRVGEADAIHPALHSPMLLGGKPSTTTLIAPFTPPYHL